MEIKRMRVVMRPSDGSMRNEPRLRRPEHTNRVAVPNCGLEFGEP